MTDVQGPVKSVTYGTLVWQQFRRNGPALVGLALVGVFFVLGTFAPFIASDRPLLVRVDPARTTPFVTFEGALPRTGTFSPVVENLSHADVIVLVIFTWVVLVLLIRLLTVNADNPTRRWALRLPRLLRQVGLWVISIVCLVTVTWIFMTPEGIRDVRTDWDAVCAKASPGDVIWRAPIPYRPYQRDLDSILMRPSWMGAPESAVRSDQGVVTEGEPDGTTTPEEPPGQPGTGYHLLGTDHLGRDVGSQLVHGARISLVVGFVSVGIALTIGTFIGALGGYFGGKVDFWVMRLIEVMMCFPTIFLILTVSVLVKEASVFSVMTIIGITGWVGPARLVRGDFFKQRSMEYVTAAQALGGSPMRLMFRHILPNAMAPLLVSATFGIAGAILTESTLSFLNLGVPPDVASWGRTLSYGVQNIRYAWWLILFPGLIIFITVTSYNLAGEGLRDAVDPRMRT